MDLQTYGALNGKIENLKKNSLVVPQTAEVGQVLAVKAVDEDGKPTEWETVKAGGGDESGVQWFIVDNHHTITWDGSGASYLVCSGSFRKSNNTIHYIAGYATPGSSQLRVWGVKINEAHGVDYLNINKGEVIGVSYKALLGFIKSDVDAWGFKQIYL